MTGYERRLWTALGVVAVLFVCGAAAYQAGYGEGRERALAVNVSAP